MEDHKKRISGSRIFRGVILLLNSLAIILLLAAYGAYHISPTSIPALSFAGLAYPYILLANVLFFLFWVVTRFKYAVISLLFIVVGWNHIGRLIQLTGNKANPEESKGIKVMSYNLQNFLKINTSTTRYVTDMTNENNIMDFLSEQDADIVCLQEMLNDRQNSDTFIASMSQLLSCPYAYCENYFATTTGKLDAVAIFSKYPILETGHLTYERKTIGIFTDLLVRQDTVRVYNLHLASIHFKKEDYQFWSEIKNNQEQDSLRAGTFRIFSKISAASVKRSKQVGQITAHMKSSDYPIIICGDFNDSPSSYTYRKIAEGKKDAFVESGSGLGSTYAGEYFPSFRIDFILFDASYSAYGFQRLKLPYSDHYPISCYLNPN